MYLRLNALAESEARAAKRMGEAASRLDERVKTHPYGSGIIAAAVDLVEARTEYGFIARLRHNMESVDPILAYAFLVDEVDGDVLRYRGARSTSAAHNLEDEVVHATRCSFLADARTYGADLDGETISYDDTRTAVALYRRAQREQREAVAAEAKAEYRKLHGSPLHPVTGKAFSRAAALAVLRRADVSYKLESKAGRWAPSGELLVASTNNDRLTTMWRHYFKNRTAGKARDKELAAVKAAFALALSPLVDAGYAVPVEVPELADTADLMTLRAIVDGWEVADDE